MGRILDLEEKLETEKSTEEATSTTAIAEAEETTLSAKTAIQKAAPTVDWWKVLRWVYLAGLLVFGLNFLVQFGQLILRLIRYPGHDLGEYRLVEMSEDAAPYSFWNRIFLNPERYDPDTFHQIFQHEQIHVKQKHSIDLLLAELLIVFQWFNPFAWLYRAAIEHNLEFLTDAEMLRIGNDPESYQLSLVKVAVPNFPNGLVASYNQNFLEKRITMMKTKKSSVRSGWKYLSLLPLLLVSVLQFNAVAQAPVASVDPVPPTPAASTASVTPPTFNVQTPAPAAAPTNLAVPTPSPVPVEAPMTVPTPAPQAAPVPNAIPAEVLMPEVQFTEAHEANMNMKLRAYGLETGRNSWTAYLEGSE
ncbi:MAG: M56 family metallopeptidase, partial [Bacteroidota bacterium]